MSPHDTDHHSDQHTHCCHHNHHTDHTHCNNNCNWWLSQCWCWIRERLVTTTYTVDCKKKVAKFRFVIVSARSSRTLHDVREPVARDFASMSRSCARLSSRRCTRLGSRKCTRPVSRTCTRLAERAPVKYTRALLQRAASSRLSLCDLHHVSLLAVPPASLQQVP